jgi:Zn-dependent protease with chaperone function
MGFSTDLLEAAPAAEAMPAAEKSPEAASVEALMGEFKGTFEPTQLSNSYRFGMAVVFAGMLVLLAVYVGIIVLSAYGVYYHLKEDSSIIQDSANYFGVLAYLWPAVAGGVLVFFMVKPILAGKPEQPPRYSLTPESDPILFAFIGRICELVRAPLPSRVDVDCQINASASFRRGLRSMRGRDVVLTIGLPLAQGLTMQEFAGVLAHEFGHFAQGAGMKLTYLVRAISGWFARVVYERDEWDVRLVRAAHSVDIRVGIWLHMIRLLVWLTRRVLWVLMQLGHAISCYMLRQMEYDADSYETKLAGSDAFASTVTKIQELIVAGQLASQKMQKSWEGRRLPQNLPSFIKVCTRNIPRAMRQKFEDEVAKKKTRFLDTHPCDIDRVNAAKAMNQAGVFHSVKPASELFKGFDQLCAAASRFHYEHNLDLRITDHNLVPQEIAERDSQSEAEGEQALPEFFYGLKPRKKPIRIREDAAESRSVQELIEEVKRARQAMEQSKPAVQKALGEYEQAQALYQRGFDAIRQDSQQATTRATEAMQLLEPTLETFEGHAAARMSGALQLLKAPEIAQNIEESSRLQEEADQLREVISRLGDAMGPLGELARTFSAFRAALEAVGSEKRRNTRVEQAEARLNELGPRLKKLLATIREPLAGVPYPFHHSRQDLTLDEFAKNDIPASNKLQSICNDCTCHLDRLQPLYFRVLSRLAFISLQVERQI